MSMSLSKALEFVANDKKRSLAIEFIDATSAQLKEFAKKCPTEVVEVIQEMMKIAPNVKSRDKVVAAAVQVFPSLAPKHMESFDDLLDAIAGEDVKVSQTNAAIIIKAALPLIPAIAKEKTESTVDILDKLISVTDDHKLVKSIFDAVKPFVSLIASEDRFGGLYHSETRATREIKNQIKEFSDELSGYRKQISIQEMDNWSAGQRAHNARMAEVSSFLGEHMHNAD